MLSLELRRAEQGRGQVGRSEAAQVAQGQVREIGTAIEPANEPERRSVPSGQGQRE